MTIQECQQIIGNNYIGYLGYLSLLIPSVVPITYYFNFKNNSLISYAIEGHKMSAMRKNKVVSIQISEITSVNQWKSVLVHGIYEELDGVTAKAQLHLFTEGVKELVNREEKMDVHFIGDFSRKIHGEGHPIVYRIKIIDVTGKERNS